MNWGRHKTIASWKCCPQLKLNLYHVAVAGQENIDLAE